jgi:hypothetical protein
VTTMTLVLLSASYVAVAALLLSLNLASAWRWQIKLAGILIVSALYIGTYVGAEGLSGWPSQSAMPGYFRLHWAVVTEPDKFSGEDGRILVWAEALDESDRSLSPPRAFKLSYDDELARRIERALGMVSEGQAVTGSLKTESTGEEADEDGVPEAGKDGAGGDATRRTTGPPPEFYFEQMRPPPRPTKQLL